jgi:CRISPR-associated exonuclease Cas4
VSQLPWRDMALLLAAAVVILASVWMLRRAGGKRREANLPPGELVYADTGDWRPTEAPLFSKTYGLTGKPDYLIRSRGTVTPVEVKSGATPPQPYPAHILQLAAYCLLAEETYSARVPYGLIRYPEGVYKVEFNAGLRRALLQTLQQMRADLQQYGEGAVARSHEDAARCAGCGFRDVCDQRLG